MAFLTSLLPSLFYSLSSPNLATSSLNSTEVAVCCGVLDTSLLSVAEHPVTATSANPCGGALLSLKDSSAAQSQDWFGGCEFTGALVCWGRWK